MTEWGRAVEETSFFTDHTGTKTFYRAAYEPTNNASLVVCHGLGEHSGRYERLTAAARKMGLAVFAMDHAGHGQSGGNRGCIDSFDQLVLAVRRVADIAGQAVGPDKKLFVLGHSMGGLIAAITVLRFPELFAGAILSSPALGLAVKVPPLKAAAGRVLAGLLPSLTLDNELNPEHLSRVPEEVKAYVEDPLVHRRVSTRLFSQMMAQMDEAHGRADRFRTPLLGFHGTGDRITDHAATRRFVERAASSDKTFKTYEGAYHETMNDVCGAEVVADVARWLADRL